MVLRDCKKGMVHWPEGDRNIPVLVEKTEMKFFFTLKAISFRIPDLYRRLIFMICKRA